MPTNEMRQLVQFAALNIRLVVFAVKLERAIFSNSHSLLPIDIELALQQQSKMEVYFERLAD